MTPLSRIKPRRVCTAVLTALLSLVPLAWWTNIALHSPQTGWDFPVFYIAGHLPLDCLYDASAFADYWRNHLQLNGVSHWAPFVRLPLFAIPLHYLLNLPYHTALCWWVVLGGLSYLVAVGLLTWKLRLPILLIPACLAYFPAALGIITGADIGFFCLALVLAFLFLESDSPWLAAVALTLCLAKYNLVALFPLMLALQKRFRALGGFVAAALLLAVSTLCLTSMRTYLAALEAAPALAGHFTPMGLRGLTDAISFPDLYPFCAVMVILICCWLFRKLDIRTSVAVAITGALMVSPYVTWYDSAVLVIPVLIVISEARFGLRSFCILLLIAIPLWSGFGATEFTHISVECLLLIWFVARAHGLRKVKTFDTGCPLGALLNHSN